MPFCCWLAKFHRDRLRGARPAACQLQAATLPAQATSLPSALCDNKDAICAHAGAAARGQPCALPREERARAAERPRSSPADTPRPLPAPLCAQTDGPPPPEGVVITPPRGSEPLLRPGCKRLMGKGRPSRLLLGEVASAHPIRACPGDIMPPESATHWLSLLLVQVLSVGWGSEGHPFASSPCGAALVSVRAGGQADPLAVEGREGWQPPPQASCTWVFPEQEAAAERGRRPTRCAAAVLPSRHEAGARGVLATRARAKAARSPGALPRRGHRGRRGSSCQAVGRTSCTQEPASVAARGSDDEAKGGFEHVQSEGRAEGWCQAEPGGCA